MGGGNQEVVKFFVTNLSEGCTPWELRQGLEHYGVISGTYVAKKRDKMGNRFGFIGFQLKINLARFAVENSGYSDQPEAKIFSQNAPRQADSVRSFTLRDGRSFRDVLGKSQFREDGCAIPGDPRRGGVPFSGKSLVVPDRTSAFSDLWDLAVVGRTVDLETLVDLDKLLCIAKVPFLRIQYLGGLSVLISISNGESANKFLDSKVVWGPWFSKLESWQGQSLPLERVAWLRMLGIPIHLVEEEVLSTVGELFGKVIHVPKSFFDDSDLSLLTVGVLAGEAGRIKEMVSLSWKGRCFRIWVEEEREPWVPDCLGSVSDLVQSSDDSPMASSPVGNVEAEGSPRPVGRGGEEESHGLDVRVSHANIGNTQDEREKGGCGVSVDNEVSPRNLDCRSHVSNSVGPNDTQTDVGPLPNPFNMGLGDRSLRSNIKFSLGSRLRKTRSQPTKDSSPVEVRPVKRPRPVSEAYEPGFGFIGFTNSAA
ncbi:putative RNA recognition motif domain, RNA-binding domain superfamily [Helianthus annuus]|nr:putative RNA recognition motif domain, RNA-binding domain superfamily [Helianthus annuus]